MSDEITELPEGPEVWIYTGWHGRGADRFYTALNVILVLTGCFVIAFTAYTLAA